MTYSWPIYIVLGIVVVVSFGTAFFLPTVDILRWVFSIPALVALIGVVLQILRDDAQHKKAQSIQQDQQHFILGVTSHMANVVFDKHVAFCEKYISLMQEFLSTLFRDGPTRNGLEMASSLAIIRHSFRTWLTSDIQAKMLPFEQALSTIGIRHAELQHLQVGDERNQAVEEMHNIFADILGIPRLEGRGKNNEEVAANHIMDHLQDILGVKQLIRLRIKLVDEAVKTLDKKN